MERERKGEVVPVAGERKAPSARPGDAEVQARVQARYGQLPLSFEVNQGQTDPQVEFLARGGGYSLFLTGQEAMLSLGQGSSDKCCRSRDEGRALRHPSPVTRHPSPAVLRMKLLGANPSAKGVGEEELPGKVNYFLGNDPKKWRTNVTTYQKVRYREVYPGVDLVYYGHQGQLEYDFVVAPGADPAAIRLGFAGAERVAVDGQGHLVLHSGQEEVHWRKPVVYQEVDGVRQEVSGRYVLRPSPIREEFAIGNCKLKIENCLESGQSQIPWVGFAVGRYDPTHPLIIDPVLVYSTYLGGNDDDTGHGIAVDSSGCAYVTGRTFSSDFPTVNPYQTDQGGSDVFVAKLDANGSALLYSTYLGGRDWDRGWGLAVDSTGCAYVTGDTTSPDFPTVNPYQTQGGVFVTKLNADGSSLVYSTYLGENSGTCGDGMAVDSSGHAYVMGTACSTQGVDVFVAKLAADGSSLVYYTSFGGSKNDWGWGGAVDSSGCAYVTGGTESTDFPTVNPYQTDQGGSDIFVTKLSADGSTLLYSTYLGGNGGEAGWGLAVDSTGCAYVTGPTTSTDFPTMNPYQPALKGDFDAFVTKLSADGSTLVCSTYLGGNGDEEGMGIAVDSSGRTYVSGKTWSTDFPTVNPYQTYQGPEGVGDAFVTKLAAEGSALLYSTYLGGNGGDEGWFLAVDSTGCAYVSGRTSSTDFPMVNPYQTDRDWCDAFITKISHQDLQPDLWIKQGPNWRGDDVYNPDGTDQTASRTGGAGQTIVYPARLYNDGDEDETFWIKGPSGDANWTVQYYGGTTVNPAREVTPQVTRPQGWKRADVPPGGVRSFVIAVTPASGVLGSYAVLVTAHSDLDPTQVDAIQAVTTVPDVQPDLWIKHRSNWCGNGLYNDDGTDQTASRAVLAGTPAVYPARLYNDGSETETFWIKGPAGDADWTVQYFQGTTEVTTQVTSATGWKRPRVPVGGMRAFSIKVTPNSGASGSFAALVRAEAQRDPTQRDTLKTITRVK